jgi:YVTN family beta-propeller protein
MKITMENNVCKNSSLVTSVWRKYLLGAGFSAAFLFVLFGCSLAKHSSIRNLIGNKPDNFSEQALVGPQGNGTYLVTTSQIIDPAGKTLTFPGRPVDLALNPEGTILAVKNIQDIVFFDVINQTIKQVLTLPEGASNTFTGILWSNNGQKVWTTDTKGYLRSAKMMASGLFAWDDAFLLPAAKILTNGVLAWEDEILIPESVRTAKNMAYPGGFVLDEQHGFIYVTLNRYNSVGIINLKTGKYEGHIPVGIAPYDIIVEKNKAYVSNWGGRLPVPGDKTALSSGIPVVVDPKTGIASSGTVSVIDLTSRKVIKEIEVRLHPSGMTIHPDGSRLFVANANSDLISVINTKTDEVIKELSSKPMAELPFGSAPNALAIAPDGNTLYVANGGNNLIAVIDLRTGSLNGLIPTGWYPGAVTLNRNGNTLFVANTKGVGGRYLGLRKKIGYKSNDHLGSVSFIPVPSKDTLEKYTVRAATNMRLPKINQTIHLEKVKERIVPVPTKPGERSVFKHVLYIIKENKTYDQVFGDLPQANGDSSLCQFGRNITPNHHSLAENFVVLDNTYCNGVLSADGHQWTNEGYVTDYLEKSFGGFARSYPYEGDDPLAFASSGFIWDNVLRHGLSFRDYGEFVKAVIEPEKATWTDVYNDYINNTNHVKIKATSEVHTLRPFLCPTFIGFPQTVPDVYRAREFIKELHACEAKDSLPNFMIMLLPNDHTTGTKEGFPTPKASIADNDLALGQIVEAVSKSKFWKETAIFVIQDDPQSGLDHVDGKRTVAFCISPYTKRGEVVSTQYNQNSILRTIELILGLPPMSQFDLTATPMVDCFRNEPDFTPYTALPSNIPLDQLNPKLASLKGKQKYWAKKSMEMPFEEVDMAEDDVLNRIIWYAVKGYDVPYPKIRKR